MSGARPLLLLYAFMTHSNQSPSTGEGKSCHTCPKEAVHSICPCVYIYIYTHTHTHTHTHTSQDTKHTMQYLSNVRARAFRTAVNSKEWTIKNDIHFLSAQQNQRPSCHSKPSGYFIYHQVFCPLSVYMCFAGISQ
jgi:hypothetical protein